MESEYALRSLYRHFYIRPLSLIVVFCALVFLGASAAHAQLREYRVDFRPSLSPNAAGHLLHIGTQTGVYETSFDLGKPPASGGFLVYSVDLDASAGLFVAMRTYDAQGALSPYSNEIRVLAVAPPPAPPVPPVAPSSGGGGGSGPSSGSGSGGGGTGSAELDPDEVVLGLTTTALGWVGQLDAAGNRSNLSFDTLASTGDLRPARCDLDGDGDQDIVLGYDDRSAGVIAVLIMENDRIFSTKSIVSGTVVYRYIAGMTYPACGDLDGDGLAEIAIGFGPEMNGFVQVLDDIGTDFAPIQSSRSNAAGMIDVATRGLRAVPLFPAIGDIDGDGIGELVIGSGKGSSVGIVLLDDRTTDFRPHPSAQARSGQIQPMPRDWFSNTLDVARRPAVGDVDGDGRDEIVVSFGRGSRGQIMILDDASTTYPRFGRASDQTIVAGHDGYRLVDGEVVATLGDIDRDGRAEIVVGFARTGDGELQVFDDKDAGYAPILGPGGFVNPMNSGWTIVPLPKNTW